MGNAKDAEHRRQTERYQHVDTANRESIDDLLQEFDHSDAFWEKSKTGTVREIARTATNDVSVDCAQELRIGFRIRRKILDENPVSVLPLECTI